MADLDFSKHVSEVPAGAALPKPYERSVSSQSSGIPDLQSAITNYADATNWMSNVGSFIASKAATATAQKIGGELGKNPQGDIGIPLTDFDKTMQQSYETQAQATLGLQANKLISDSNIEAAKADRVTPELIAKTNKNISIGLQNIFKHAPSSIQPHLEYQYGTLQMNQAADLTDRMMREQKEDRRNNTALSAQTNAEHAYSFGLRGDDKAAEAAIETTRRLSQADVNSRLLTPEQAKANVDTARKSYLNGKLIHQYEDARAKGKGAEYLKSVADNKSGLSDADYMSVTNNLMGYVTHQDALRSQDEQLRLSTFQANVALNPTSPDISRQLQDLKNNVSPEAFQKAQLHYINALSNDNTQQNSVSSALAGWKDSSSFARLGEKAINRAFDMQVGALVQQKQKEGKPISKEEAEVQVAYSAGGPVPVFNKEMQDNLLSGRPSSIASASRQIAMLNELDAGRVYDGISPKAKAIATQFRMQEGSMPDDELARKITDNLSNIDGNMQKTLDNSWSQQISNKGSKSGVPLYKIALKEVIGNDLNQLGNKSLLGNNAFQVIYGNDLYNQLQSNFMTTRGDYDAAVAMTKDYYKQHYGETHVNGYMQITDSPIEKYLGYPGNNITPYVQRDLMNQLSVSFAEAKKSHPDDYWEVSPSSSGTVEAIRTMGGKKYRYPIQLIGRAGNQWDVAAETPYGPRNLFLVAPNLGITTYKPNKAEIEKNYLASRNFKSTPLGRGLETLTLGAV